MKDVEKIKTSVGRIYKMLEFANIVGDTIQVDFNKDGAYIKQADGSMVMAVLHRFDKSYFTEYNISGSVQFPNDMAKALKSFKSDDVTMTVHSDKIVVTGDKEEFEINRPDTSLNIIPDELIETDIGRLTKTIQENIMAVYVIDISEFKGIKGNVYTVEFSDKELKFSVKTENSRYTRKITLIKSNVKKGGKATISGEYFNKILGNISGPFNLVFVEDTDEEGEVGEILVTQKMNDFELVYVLTPYNE